jgi:hypothetical protein
MQALARCHCRGTAIIAAYLSHTGIHEPVRGLPIMSSPVVHQPHERPAQVRVRMRPIEGSNSIRRLGYNPETQQLVVHFYDSLPELRTVYSPVPPQLFEQLLAADSMGQFVEQHIRYTYDFSLVREEALVDPESP